MGVRYLEGELEFLQSIENLMLPHHSFGISAIVIDAKDICLISGWDVPHEVVDPSSALCKVRGRRYMSCSLPMRESFMYQRSWCRVHSMSAGQRL